MKKAFTRTIFATQNLRGFTLVELLVGISIVAVVFSVGIANYRDFSRRQELQGVTRKMVGDIRLAQQLSLNGEKPTACDRLSGYNINVTTNSYSIVAICDNGTTNYKTVDLSSQGLTLSATTASTLFKTLGLGTNLTSQNIITITSTNTGNIATVTIGAGGDIR